MLEIGKKNGSFQRRVTTYYYPLKRRKSPFRGPKFQSYSWRACPRTPLGWYAFGVKDKTYICDPEFQLRLRNSDL